ncbi:MAG: hypothetical protein K2G26_04735, partial [Clostridia bacterium]|nr:hypothetical protein [Clostridia bacterium]
MPTGNSVINNIYSDGSFSKNNLDELASRVGYTNGVDEMVAAVEDGDIKTSADFGVTVVKFGSYTYSSKTYELSWIPTYLSTDDNGNAILTLWLASTQDKNTVSAHEISKFSDTSNLYDSSYIRNNVLNSTSANAKFKLFTSGDVASCIVTPGQVSWQKEASYQKNDPRYTREATSQSWLNDKVWLPSMYEVFDGALTANSTKVNCEENGGLWQVGNSGSRNKRTNSLHYWVRSGLADGNVYIIGNDGSIDYGSAQYSWAIRPALHLNLSAANPYINKPTAAKNLTYNGSEQAYTPKGFYSNYMEITDNKQTLVGDYTCTVTLKSGYVWDDDSTDPVEIDYKIEKAKPNVKAEIKDALPNPLYTTYNNGKLPEIINRAEKATPGTLEWQSGQSPSAKDSAYYWQFTPDDTDNYQTITGRSDDTKITIAYKAPTIDKLELTLLTDKEGAPLKIYDAYSLKDLKNYITVKAVYNDSDDDDKKTKETLGDSDFDFELTNGKNKLTEGDVTVRAKDKNNNTGTLTLNVLKAEVEELSATYNDGGTHLVYSEELDYDCIKTNLSVTARWNYSGNKFLDVDNKDVTLSGDIQAGEEVEFTVEYGGKSYVFYVDIDKAEYDTSGVGFKPSGGGNGGSGGSALKPDANGGFSGTYSPDGGFDLTIDPETLPDGVTAGTPVIKKLKDKGNPANPGDWEVVSEIDGAGEYKVEVELKGDGTNYEKLDPVTTTVTIKKADVNMEDVKWTPDKKQIHVDGNSYTLKIDESTLPTQPVFTEIKYT